MIAKYLIMPCPLPIIGKPPNCAIQRLLANKVSKGTMLTTNASISAGIGFINFKCAAKVAAANAIIAVPVSKPNVLLLSKVSSS